MTDAQKAVLTDEEQKRYAHAIKYIKLSVGVMNTNISNEFAQNTIITFVSLADTRIESEARRKMLKEVMEWIDNWSPDFTDDDEWQETKDKVDALLTPKGE